MGRKISILQLSHIRDGACRVMDEHFDVIRIVKPDQSKAYLDNVPRTVRAIVSGIPPVRIGAEIMDALPDLELICNFGVGYDFIDVKAAAKCGIVVTNTPNIVDEDVADLAVGLMLATVRQIPQAHNFVLNGEWSERPFWLTPTLRDRHVGFVGFGRIGQAIARRCAAFGVDISYHARNERKDVSYPYYSSAVALAKAVDLMMVITPGGEGTRNLIDAKVLKALGPNGILINMARGSVVDEPALIRALEKGIILAAGLDVFAAEPSVPDALKRMKNVVLLPHIGGATEYTRDNISTLIVDNLLSWFSGKGPLTPVTETQGLKGS